MATGTLTVQEAGLDTLAGSGQVTISSTLTVQEIGGDFSVTGTLPFASNVCNFSTLNISPEGWTASWEVCEQ